MRNKLVIEKPYEQYVRRPSPIPDFLTDLTSSYQDSHAMWKHSDLTDAAIFAYDDEENAARRILSACALLLGTIACKKRSFVLLSCHAETHYRLGHGSEIQEYRLNKKQRINGELGDASYRMAWNAVLNVLKPYIPDHEFREQHENFSARVKRCDSAREKIAADLTGAEERARTLMRDLGAYVNTGRYREIVTATRKHAYAVYLISSGIDRENDTRFQNHSMYDPKRR